MATEEQKKKKDRLAEQAKIAEQAERYEDMARVCEQFNSCCGSPL